MSKLNTVRDGWHILRLILRLLREDRPLPFFGAVALILTLSAGLLFVPVLREYATTGLVPRLPTFLLSTVCGVLACLSLSVGLILSTVTRGRKEAKRLQYLSIAAPWSRDETRSPKSEFERDPASGAAQSQTAQVANRSGTLVFDF